jgi:hypothetical protein
MDTTQPVVQPDTVNVYVGAAQELLARLPQYQNFDYIMFLELHFLKCLCKVIIY